jgi:selenocysteine lyase/cysteine desulfurase
MPSNPRLFLDGLERHRVTLDLELLRAETPGCGHRVHFNNAGSGLMPASVLAAMVDHLRLEADIGGYEAADARADAIADFYAATAELIGCGAHQVAFTSSATDAFSRALSAVPFAPGDVILTTRDDYISNQIAFLSLTKRFGVEVVHAPSAPEGGADVAAMARLMRERRPRIVVATHIPTNSGLVQPVAEIGRHCRELDLLYLVDACQSAGQYPLDVTEIGCDFLSATCRKFLRGPRGSGFLFVSERALASGYEPLFIDMRGARWIAPDRYQAVAGAARFEEWEFSYAGVVGSAVATRYALAVGLDEISLRSPLLAGQLRQGLAEIDVVRVLDRGQKLCAIVTCAIEGWKPDEFKRALDERGINSAISLREYALFDFGEKDVEWCLRLSPHYYNTEAEVALVIAAIEDLAHDRRSRRTLGSET